MGFSLASGDFQVSCPIPIWIYSSLALECRLNSGLLTVVSATLRVFGCCLLGLTSIPALESRNQEVLLCRICCSDVVCTFIILSLVCIHFEDHLVKKIDQSHVGCFKNECKRRQIHLSRTLRRCNRLRLLLAPAALLSLIHF